MERSFGKGPSEDEGPVRQSFLFDMTKPDDQGQGFPMIQLPKKEPEEPRRVAPRVTAPPPPPPRRSNGRAAFLMLVVLGQAAMFAAHRYASIDLIMMLTGVVTGGMLLSLVVALKSRRLGGGFLLATLIWTGTVFALIPRAEWEDVPARAKALVERLYR